MTREDEQYSNLRWLYDLLDRPIRLSTGISPFQLRSDFSAASTFNRATFFKKSGITFDAKELQFYFDEACVSEESIGYLRSTLGGSLVIGYELSEQTRKVLSRAGINYIDIWLHPIRYMADILFGVSSGSKEVFEKIKKYQLDEEYLYQYATKYKISTYKGWKRVSDKLDVKPNSALFVGQTLYDKAVSLNGKMLSILDFKDRLDEISSQYSEVLYSRHPYLKNGDEDVIKFIKSSRNIKLTNIPSYHLLAHPNIEKVATVSSSVACEAKYFEKETEFLYRPIMDLYADYSVRSYITIFRSIVNPSFWADILQPFCKTVESLPNVEYLAPQENLRDMLGFYWSYAEVDKGENLRRTVKALDIKLQNLAGSGIKKFNSGKVSVKKEAKDKVIQAFNVENAKLAIDKAEVVSFDLFDTLVYRCLESPNDLLDLVSLDVFEGDRELSRKFSAARKASRNKIKSEGLAEEVLLKDRYQAVLSEDDWSNLELSAEELERKEFDIDIKCLDVRPSGKELFDYALSQKKIIVISTDTYYSVSFIKELLGHFNYEGYHKIFSSSEIGYTKHTGNIFPVILSRLNLTPKEMLHIGDNKRSDVDNALAHGIQSIFLPSVESFFRDSNKLTPKHHLRDEVMNSVYKGLLAQRNDVNLSKIVAKSFTGGGAKELGYRTVGLFMYGFAKWILESALEDEVEDLIFLSRDGQIVKRVVDLFIEKNSVNNVRTHYLYASRRSLSVASIYTLGDALEILKINFSPITPADLLVARFGLDREVIEPVISELFGKQELVKSDSAADLDKLGEVLRTCVSHLLEVSGAERAALKKYYSMTGAFNTGKAAVVDIGHNGTLQRYISKFMDVDGLAGYYFVTYVGVQSNVIELGMKAKGYLGEFLDAKDPRHAYKQNLIMFELAFINKEQSFVRCIEDEAGNVQKEFLSTEGDLARSEFCEKLHSGVVEFCSDLEDKRINLGRVFQLNAEESITPYLEFIRKPAYCDAQMLMNVAFENKYSGRNLEYIIGRGGAKGLWKEGHNLLLGGAEEFDKSPFLKENEGFIRRNIRKLVADRSQIKRDIINVYSYLKTGEFKI
ncbi:HAD family hydrolase [Microbulbifer sp. VAAC004]|uniref:HAD family hydrolase n=1 Tax=unclassified Microbulbifer TaxID=2619833 RepID=UPI00403A0AFF